MKFENFPPVYYINLKDNINRKESIESQFKEYGIQFTRIEAFDGRESDLSEYISGPYPGYGIKTTEVGCTCSHLFALKYWLETNDSDYAIICEDDLDLSLSEYWNFTWQDFINNLPDRWDCIQLTTTHLYPEKTFIVPLHERQNHIDWSTCCYMIKRNYAKKLIEAYCKDDKFALSSFLGEPVADSILYLGAIMYSISLFAHKINFGSNIHPHHTGCAHKLSRDYVFNWWQAVGQKLDITHLTKMY